MYANKETQSLRAAKLNKTMNCRVICVVVLAFLVPDLPNVDAIDLKDNGYRDVVVSISPDIKEDNAPLILNNIKVR